MDYFEGIEFCAFTVIEKLENFEDGEKQYSDCLHRGHGD